MTASRGTILLFALSAISLIPTRVGAQNANPRFGRTLSLDAETAAVWLSPHEVFSANHASALSACYGEGACAPVTASETCAYPACPGSGHRLTVAHDLAPVPAFPTDYAGYQASIDAIRQDPAFAAIAPYLQDHADHARVAEARARHDAAAQLEAQRRAESVRWNSHYRHGDRFELSMAADLATLAVEGGTYAGGTATFGMHLQFDASESDDTDEDEVIDSVLLGDTMGFDVRAHFLYRLDTAQSAEWMTLIGAAFVSENRFELSQARLPTVVGVAVPEIGVAIRSDRAPTPYFGWTVPFSFMASHDVAIDLGLRALLVFDWAEAAEDPDEPGVPQYQEELLVMVSAGVRFL